MKRGEVGGIIVGIDESGTGAWAGPFVVCACAVRFRHQQSMADLGVADSKTLSDDRRRQLMDIIADHSIIASTIFVSVDRMNSLGHRGSWRWAVRTAALDIHRKLGDVHTKIVVDGGYDSIFAAISGEIPAGELSFCPKADKYVPAVSAASIVAKTMRNDAMIQLAAKYPGYSWEKNAGYGTSDHIAAIKDLGFTPQHRKMDYAFLRKP